MISRRKNIRKTINIGYFDIDIPQFLWSFWKEYYLSQSGWVWRYRESKSTTLCIYASIASCRSLKYQLLLCNPEIRGRKVQIKIYCILDIDKPDSEFKIPPYPKTKYSKSQIKKKQKQI